MRTITYAAATAALAFSCQVHAGGSVQALDAEERRDGRDQASPYATNNGSAAQSDDPARNINLAVAYARAGQVDQARAHFVAALRSETRVELETATGAWVDSRVLAREGLCRLSRGEFSEVQVATLR